MLITEQDKLRESIEGWVEKYGRDRSSLLPILQEIQKRHFYVPPYAMQVLADLLGIHPVEVHGVVTFYSFLKEAPQGKFVVRLCRTIACDMVGKDRVARQLQNDLGIDFGETTPDGAFTLEWTNCLGMCDQGPAMMVNDHIHTRVTPDKVHEIIADCRRRLSPSARQEEQEHVV